MGDKNELLDLTLRQKKILYALQYAQGTITGPELAKQLHVTDRTIRSDIKIINDALAPYGAKILSVKAYGYKFQAKDPGQILRLNHIENAYMTKENRIRYITFLLCLADEPVSQYDLEDRMYVSSTTMQSDLRTIHMKYEYEYPSVLMAVRSGDIYFIAKEADRRGILANLYFEGWNYESKGNAYYQDNYMSEHLFEDVSEKISQALQKHGIRMEDPSLIHLNISLSLAMTRVLEGHTLPVESMDSYPDLAAYYAGKELMDQLELAYDCTLNSGERWNVYQMISQGHLIQPARLSRDRINNYFRPEQILAADTYLETIHDFYGIDLSLDEDFYMSLLNFISLVTEENYIMNGQVDMASLRQAHYPETVLADLFRPIAKKYLDYDMNDLELFYLTNLLIGVMEFTTGDLLHKKLNVVICCHMNLPVSWMLKRRILGAFSNYLDVTMLLPVNSKSDYDFTDVDLIISTVSKPISAGQNTDTLVISPEYTTRDRQKIIEYLSAYQIRSLVSQPYRPDLLFHDAYFYDNADLTDRFSIIEFLTSEMIIDGIAPMEMLEDVLQRESVFSAACRDDILFLYTNVPSTQTKLSVVSLTNRINWGHFKIKCVILAAFKEEERGLIFPLSQELMSCDINELSGRIRTSHTRH